MRFAALQTRVHYLGTIVERTLESERDQLPLWLPVAFGCGIAAWFVLDGAAQRGVWALALTAMALAGLALPNAARIRQVVVIAALTAAAGTACIALRADHVASAVLVKPVVVSFTGRVETVELRIARNQVRLIILPQPGSDLPHRVRVTFDLDKVPSALSAGAVISLRARLVAPPGPSVPGGFDFARAAWFSQLGATGKAIGPVAVLKTGPAPGLRQAIGAHIRAQIPGSAGGIAAAFASGDRGGIAPSDEDAMRASGLTHLLSVSGLHVTAVVGAAMILARLLLALSPVVALRAPVLMLSALAGALAGIGYTLLTGAEVPTVRSCVAALLVVLGITLGREAITLRSIAVGALVVLLVWPEALVGPSFQLSFAAVASIVALHDLPVMRRIGDASESGLLMRLARSGLALLLTGLVVEAVLAPIAFFHFHRSGIYGAAANIIAIPLTTFVIMPLEALALLFDTVGLGAPLWWLTGNSLNLLLWLARTVAVIPGAQAGWPDVPSGAFALIAMGGLWLILWKTPLRRWGSIPVVMGLGWVLSVAPPDLLITGDGVHMAVRDDIGNLAILRPRAGDYVRSVFAERSGELGDLSDLDSLADATCSEDLCQVTLTRGGRKWNVVATRSHLILPSEAMQKLCAKADIVVSDRRLPTWCAPRWFKADRSLLEQTGGLAVNLTTRQVETVAETRVGKPWVTKTPNIGATVPRGAPAHAPG